MTPEEKDAVEVGRVLAEAGVPVFVAHPDNSTIGFRLPKGWQNQPANPKFVDAWRPGLALCAVMGYGLDLIDLDPRNGGDVAALNGAMPKVYAVAATPSGGWHGFIASMGVRSRDNILPGIDIKAGTDGQGHGFAFIAPTVRASKVTGELLAYEWQRPPDPTALTELGGDDSGKALADIVNLAHGSRRTTNDDLTEGEARDWMVAETIPKGSRYPWLRSYAGWMRERNVPLAEARVLMKGRWQTCEQPPDYVMPWEDAERLLLDIYTRYPPGTPAPTAATIGQPSDGEQGRQLRAISAAEITMRASRWLWEESSPQTFRAPGGHDSAQWLPLGALCLLGGREGTGKSTWAYRVAAKLTTGTLPGSFFGQPKAVVIVATEDSWAHTIKPRLAAAGAGMDRVYRVDAVEDGFETGLTLPADVAGLHRLCDERDVAMVLLDPLMGTIDGRLDSHKDHEVRRALEPLSRLAHDAELTILGLIHVNKSTGADLLTRLMASRAFSAVARSVLMTSKEEPESGAEDMREMFIFGQAKNNLAARVPYSIRYHIEGSRVGHDDELDLPIWSSKVITDGVAYGPIDELVRAQENRSTTRETVRDRAEKWLNEYLTDKDPVPSPVVKAAAKEAGFSPRTIQRARDDLEVLVLPIEGTNNQTTWSLESLGTTDTTDTTDTTGTTGTASDSGTEGDNLLSAMSGGASRASATVPPRGWHDFTKRTGDETCEHGLLLTTCGPCWFQRGGR